MKCRKIQKSKVAKTKNGRIMLLSKCFYSEKSKFIKQLESSGLLSSLGVKTPLSKIPVVGHISLIELIQGIKWMKE